MNKMRIEQTPPFKWDDNPYLEIGMTQGLNFGSEDEVTPFLGDKNGAFINMIDGTGGANVDPTFYLTKENATKLRIWLQEHGF